MLSRSLSSLVLAASLLAACADAPEDVPAAAAPSAAAAPRGDFQLLARVATPTGSTAEFWQAEPGQILFTESGGPGTRPAADDHEVELARVWHAVAPTTAMPGKLVLAGMLAHERAAAPAPTEPAAPGAPEVSNGTRAGGAFVRADGFPSGSGAVFPPPSDPNDFCSPAWFFNNLAGQFCNPSDLLSFTWCWYDRWSPSVWQSGMVYDKGAVCNYNSSNDVIFFVNRQGKGATSGSWSLPSKSWRTWSFFTGQDCGIFSCTHNFYNFQTGFSGSWGDLHFAGGLCYRGGFNCAPND